MSLQTTLRRSSQTFEEPWQVKAACRGPETWLFFPPAHAERKDEREERETRAKAICQRCSVRTDCLDFAVRTREPYGIWGGLTESERQHLSPVRR